jgi:hypothetical protein
VRDPVPRSPLNDMPIALVDLLESALAKDPLSRPQSAASFADLLRQIEAGAGWPDTQYTVWEAAQLASPRPGVTRVVGRAIRPHQGAAGDPLSGAVIGRGPISASASAASASAALASASTSTSASGVGDGDGAPAVEAVTGEGQLPGGLERFQPVDSVWDYVGPLIDPAPWPATQEPPAGTRRVVMPPAAKRTVIVPQPIGLRSVPPPPLIEPEENIEAPPHDP